MPAAVRQYDFGADGAGSIVFLTSGAPAGFTYELAGGDLLVKQGGVTVLTLTVDAAGNYSVTQNAPIAHAAGDDENNQSFTIGYRVTDPDRHSRAAAATALSLPSPIRRPPQTDR